MSPAILIPVLPGLSITLPMMEIRRSLPPGCIPCKVGLVILLLEMVTSELAEPLTLTIPFREAELITLVEMVTPETPAKTIPSAVERIVFPDAVTSSVVFMIAAIFSPKRKVKGWQQKMLWGEGQ